MGVWLCGKLRVEDLFLIFTDTRIFGWGGNIAYKNKCTKLGVISSKYTESGVLDGLALRWGTMRLCSLSVCGI